MAQLILLASLSMLPVASKVASEPQQQVKTHASEGETATIKELLNRIARLEARVRQLEAENLEQQPKDLQSILPFGKRMRGKQIANDYRRAYPYSSEYDRSYAPYQRDQASDQPKTWSPFQFNGQEYYNILLNKNN